MFGLWGAHAQKTAGLIDAKRHVILTSAHPSPLSASNGFFGSKPFSKANAAPHKPNGSALNQLRTNEIAIANPPPDNTWQMREFRLPPPSDGLLQEMNVKLTPDETLRNKDLTANYVNANTPSILLQQHNVPDFWLGQKFLGNHSNVPFGTFWNNGPTVTIVNRQARHRVGRARRDF